MKNRNHMHCTIRNSEIGSEEYGKSLKIKMFLRGKTDYTTLNRCLQIIYKLYIILIRYVSKPTYVIYIRMCLYILVYQFFFTDNCNPIMLLNEKLDLLRNDTRFPYANNDHKQMKIALKQNTKDSCTVDSVATVAAEDFVVDGDTAATVNNDHVIQTQNRLITKCENTELYAMKDDNTTNMPTASESVQCATSTHNDNHYANDDDDVETIYSNTITYLMPSHDCNDNFVVADGSSSSSSKLCGACARPQRTNSFLSCRLHQSNSSIHCRHQHRKVSSNNNNEKENEEGNNGTTTNTDGCINQDIGIDKTTQQIPDSEPLSSKWDAIGIEHGNIEDIVTRQHQLKQVVAEHTVAAAAAEGITTTPTLLSSLLHQQKENGKINCDKDESKFTEHQGVQVVPSTPADRGCGVNDYCRTSSTGTKCNYKQPLKCANVENCWKIFDSSISSGGSAVEKIVQLTCNAEHHQRCADGEFCNKIGCRQCLNENVYHLANLVAKSNIVRGSPPPLLSLVSSPLPLSSVKIRVPKSSENFPFTSNRQCDDDNIYCGSGAAVKNDVIANNVAENVAGGPASPNSDNFEASNRLRRLENRFKDLSCTKKLLRACDSSASGRVSLHGSSISLCSLISDRENCDGTAVASLSVRPASAIDPPPSSFASILPQPPLHASPSPTTININCRRRSCKSPIVIGGQFNRFDNSQRLQCADSNSCDNERFCRTPEVCKVDTRRTAVVDAVLPSTIRPDTSCTPESLSTDSEEIRNIFPDDERPPTPRQQLNRSDKFQTNCEFDARNLPEYSSQLNRVLECYDELEFDYFDTDIYEDDDDDDDTSCDCSIDAIPVYRPCVVMRETAAGPLRGLLKKPNRPASSRKNRVVFDEKRNEFFDADYIILIREDCPYDEEDEEPCTCGEHELVRLCCDEGCQCTAYSEDTRTPQVSNKYLMHYIFV